MAAENWAESLDYTVCASAFGTALDFHAQDRDDWWNEKPAETILPGVRGKKTVTPVTQILSTGDTRIWHQKVEDWVQKHMSQENAPAEERQASVDVTPTAIQHKVDLVEALMSHGILQDHDLRILSEFNCATDGDEKGQIRQLSARTKESDNTPRTVINESDTRKERTADERTASVKQSKKAEVLTPLFTLVVAPLDTIILPELVP